MSTTTADSPPRPSTASSIRSRSNQFGVTHLIAGAIAGMCSKTLMQPLDLVKVRLQVQDGRSKNEYRGIVHAMDCILKNEGFFGFYRGLTPNLAAAGISWGVYFFTYNKSKDFFKRRVITRQQTFNGTSASSSPPLSSVNLGPFTHLICAGCSGITATIITNPISMIKTRLQLQGKEIQTESRLYSGAFDAFSRIIREEGFLSLYRGLGPSLLLVSNGALQFMFYEEMKKVAIRYVGGEQNLAPGHFFVMGGLAKIFSATATYPVAVTRARLFARAPDAHVMKETETKGSETQKYKNMLDVVQLTWRREGWRGFYRGLTPQLIKTAPSSAITFLIYETLMKIFNKASGSQVNIDRKNSENYN